MYVQQEIDTSRINQLVLENEQQRNLFASSSENTLTHAHFCANAWPKVLYEVVIIEGKDRTRS